MEWAYSGLLRNSSVDFAVMRLLVEHYADKPKFSKSHLAAEISIWNDCRSHLKVTLLTFTCLNWLWRPWLNDLITFPCCNEAGNFCANVPFARAWRWHTKILKKSGENYAKSVLCLTVEHCSGNLCSDTHVALQSYACCFAVTRMLLCSHMRAHRQRRSDSK